MFKIIVKDIKPGGIDVHETIAAEEIGLAKEDYMHFTAPLDVAAHIERLKNMVAAQAQITGHYESFCSRCLESVEGDLNQGYDASFPINPATEFVEVGEDIRQEVILNLPTIVLCKEDCQGICPGCGASLNTEPCRCKKDKSKRPKSSPEKGDTYRPFEKLKDIE
ncbi:MAG: YceD family protein [Candidatus Omnitrophota bacterium]|nr:YceD family protein [Candidatus Omnitrophota bacterium]